MDPTKKELYTAKRSSGLDVSSEDLKSAIQQLKADNDNTNWLLLKVDNSTTVVHGLGADGVEGLLHALSDDDIFYGGIRCTVSGRVKFYHIFFVGANVSGMKKGKATLYKSSILSLIDAHGEISTSNGLAEFSSDIIFSAIAKLTNAPVSDIVI